MLAASNIKKRLLKMTDIYKYIENETSEKTAVIVDSQLNLDDNANRVRVNPLTGAELSNYDYFKMIIKEVLADCNKSNLKDSISIADKIVKYFESDQDFKYIEFAFDDNSDKTYTVTVATNLGGYREYDFGLLDWDETQNIYVLWTGASYSSEGSELAKNSDEGVSYYDNLQETEYAIKDEIVDSLVNENRF